MSVPEVIWSDCTQSQYFVCQSKQVTHPDKVETMFTPDFVLPLDNITEENTMESLVAFADQKVLQTKLWSSANFLGYKESYIENMDSELFSSTNGITIAVWISLTALDADQMSISDFSQSSDSFNFMFFIKDKTLGVQLCDLTACTNFQAHSELKEELWTFVAFTYNNIEHTGTFFINETHGFKDNEGHHFKFDANNVQRWFEEEATSGTLRLGSQKFNNDGNNFHGKMSCFQYYSRYLVPSQVYQLMRTCYLNKFYKRTKDCPEGFVVLFNQCFMMSKSQMTFTQAELFCLGQNSDKPSHLAYPRDFLSQEMLMILAKNGLKQNQIWLGLDSRSGTQIKITNSLYYYRKKKQT